MRKLRWRKEVYEELESAANFYRERNVAVMVRLMHEFERTLRQIRKNPKLGAACGEGVRRRRVFGFPFDVIYMEHHGAIVLVAIAHHSRQSGYWRNRLP